MELGPADIFGAWLSIFLTIGVLSFLYEDNPIYKFTEHVFLGVSIGYAVVEIYYGVFKPNLIDKLMDGHYIFLIALAMVLMLFMKVSRKHGWVARMPIAFIVASYAAVKMTGEASGKLMKQVQDTMPNLVEVWATNGFWSWEADGAGIFSSLFLVLGTCACLIHFYFSESKYETTNNGIIGAGVAFLLVTVLTGLQMSGIDNIAARAFGASMLGLCASLPFLAFSPYKTWISRFGILVLMLSFGASFGYTVMGRISLAIGRGRELLGQNRSDVQYEQIQPRVVTVICLIVVIAFLVYWQKNLKPKQVDIGPT